MIFDEIEARGLTVDAIGHRWAHSRGRFTTALIDGPLLRELHTLIPLIPLHHPAMLRVIEAGRRRYPAIPHYITTDMAFHADLPHESYQYALPRQLIEKNGFRKYGFHGLSFQYVTEKVRGTGLRGGGARMVICHLGTGGSEVAAIRDGRSIDVSTGYTGLTGLVMSTRCGDIDPLLSVHLSRLYGAPIDEVGQVLNQKSGLLGVTDATSDIRDVLERCRTRKEPQAELALAMYVRSVRRYIGGFTAALGGIDTLVFTDDIGSGNAQIRERVCAGMEWCGIRMDPERNRDAPADAVARIEAPASGADILVVPTDEEIVIAEAGLPLLERQRVCG
jgi:acetate kinase